MAKERINLRDELRLYKFDFDLLQKIPCSKQENKKYQKLLKDGGALPEGVFPYGYYVISCEQTSIGRGVCLYEWN